MRNAINNFFGMESKLRIERVDEKTVKCFLSNEELEEYDIDYKDFIMRSDKAREVVQEIMEQAEIEVGYKPPQFAFDLQIMMVPEQGMVLTLSEKDPMDALDNNQIMEYLKGMKEMLTKAKEKLASRSGQSAEAAQGEPHKEKPKKAPVQINQPQEAMFAFDTLSDVIDYARVIPQNLRVKSTLFRVGEEYYLYLQKGTAAYKRYSKACIQAMEFGRLYTAEEDRIRYVKEHGEVVIPDHAIKKLTL